MSGGGSKRPLFVTDSATKVGLTQDLLEEILSKLPVDFVLRCKLVSKFWYNLISEPEFTRLHFSCFPKTSKLIMYLCGDNFEANGNLFLMDSSGIISPYITLSPRLYQNCTMQLISSFNGLLFFTRSVEEDDLSIHICNPATQEVVVLPRGSQSTITPSTGVLFDLDENTYKIFQFFCESEDGKWKYEVYKHDCREWIGVSEVVQGPVANPAFPLFPTHVCVGERMYWLVWSKRDREIPDYILSIDIDGNLNRVELPENGEEGSLRDEESEADETGFNIFTFLIEYEGCLRLVVVDDEESGVLVWLLRNHNTSSWSFEWSAILPMSSHVEAVKSIVSIGKKMLFVTKSGADAFFYIRFLDVGRMEWSQPYSSRRFGEWRPVVFPFVETLFRCT